MKKFNLLGVICLLVTNLSNATVVAIDSTTINFSAYGSPNSITGSWSASPLFIPSGIYVDHFTITLTDLYSSRSNPESIGLDSYIQFNSRDMAICWNTSRCLIDTVIGDTGSVYSDTPVNFLWDFLNRLVSGNDPQITGGNATISYSSGGDPISSSGTVFVTAYGEMTVVPVPTAAWLFGSGLLGLIGFARRKVA